MCLVLLGLVAVFSGHAFAQEPRLQFDRLQAGSQFDNVRTLSITQDTQGFLWFASYGAGLARFDGYEFKVFQHESGNPQSLAHNEVLHLNIDTVGVLWAATAGGLSKYDANTESFQTYRHESSDPTSINETYTTVSLIDGTGTLWVGTGDGLARRDAGETTFRHYPLTPERGGGMDPTFVECMFLDSSDTVWLGTLGGGLLRYDRRSDSFTRFRHDPDDVQSLANDHIRSILEDGDGTLWVGTDKGLSRFDQNHQKFETFLPEEGNAKSIIGSAIGPLYEDSLGNFWVAIDNLGLELLDRSTNTFSHYHHDPAVPTSLGAGSVWSIFEDRSGALWLGSDVINRLVPSTHAFQQFTRTIHNKRGADGRLPRKLVQTASGEIWMDGLEGLDRFDPNSNDWHRFSLLPDNPTDGHNEVSAIHEDRNGNLWASNPRHLSKIDQTTGIYTSIAIPHKPISIYVDTASRLWLCVPFYGLVEMDFEEGIEKRIFRNNTADTTAISHEFIIFAAEDSGGRFWVGTYRGLNLFDPDTGKFTRYMSSESDHRSISNDTVQTFFEDDVGNVWFGTSNGLNRYVPESDDFVHFFNGSDPRYSNFRDIIAAENGRLWLSHAGGLARFDNGDGSFENFSARDGVPSVFGPTIVRDPRDGVIYMAASDGLIGMMPERLTAEAGEVSLVLTDYRLSNEPIGIGANSGDGMLASAINLTGALTLRPDDQIVSFGFAALGYLHPERLKYGYMLEGFDDTWIETESSRRIATYTKLPAGEFTFRVRATNKRGHVVGRDVTLAVAVLPPWWQTNWAFLLYTLAAVLLIFSLIQLRTRSLRIRGIELENVVVERTNELTNKNRTIEEQAARLKTLIAAKDSYVSNISHEFRTPLTVILGPIDRLLSQATDVQARKYLETVRRNGSRLLRLVDKLLGLSKIDAGGVADETYPQPVHATIHNIVASLQSLAENKKIDVNADGVADVWVSCAADALDEIIVNLLSNSLKYTPPGGAVRISSDREDNFVLIIVRDTGYGIPKNEQENVFRRFYRVDDLADTAPGSGIGLAFVKELVATNGGTITLESEEGAGTTVTVRLPAAEAEVESITTGRQLPPDRANAEAQALSRAEAPVAADPTDQDALPLILVIEDNADLCYYLKEVLGNNLRVTFAADGESGIAQAVNDIPDLIICDVMLPKLNGLEVTRQLKHDNRTCHIPIIMLTALADQESRLRGLQELADDYIAKPFSEAELLQRVETILSIREILRHRYSRELHEGGIDAVTASLSEKDRRFMERVEKVLVLRYSDAAFTSAEFADGVSMSERQLQRKLKALVNHSPRDYLRNYRLSKAMEMLAAGSSVADATFRVGFQAQSYFAKCFKAQYGITPSQVIERESRSETGR